MTYETSLYDDKSHILYVRLLDFYPVQTGTFP